MSVSFEIGPRLHETAPDFSLNDHHSRKRTLYDLIDECGLLLCFSGDIWELNSIRRIMWVQKHLTQLALLGVGCALLVPNDSHTLNGFYMSTPLAVPFSLLADTHKMVYHTYNMTYPGLILIDRNGVIRNTWLVVVDLIWPQMQDIVDAINEL